MWTFGNDADVSVWDVSSSGHPGHLRFLILCFRVCWDGEKRLEVHLRTYLWHWYIVEHQHEAPVHLQMVEPAGAAAVLFGAGAGIWRSRGKTWKKKYKITPIGGNCEHLFNNSTTRLNLCYCAWYWLNTEWRPSQIGPRLTSDPMKIHLKLQTILSIILLTLLSLVV